MRNLPGYAKAFLRLPAYLLTAVMAELSGDDQQLIREILDERRTDAWLAEKYGRTRTRQNYHNLCVFGRLRAEVDELIKLEKATEYYSGDSITVRLDSGKPPIQVGFANPSLCLSSS